MDQKTSAVLDSELENSEFSEINVVNEVLKVLPSDSIFHAANSMPVRWVGFCGIDSSKDELIFQCNRGTSGIDGCTSTALGTALKTEKPVILLTGDMGFFYDRNAFWQDELPNNLKVIILNNSGGGIFRLIKGPSDQPELEHLFETRHNLDALNTAEDFGIRYSSVNSMDGFHDRLKEFLGDSISAGIFEIFTNREANRKVLDQIKKVLKDQLDIKND
jgi:2-succinyl-5-enolpyruvyl-6-hydroxy-3-cyclohexene-1-carboxylate synthase